MKRIWRDIKGYEGLYMVSNYGEVKSLERTVYVNMKNKVYLRKLKGRQLKQLKINSGYNTVLLYDDNSIAKRVTTHSIVASSFPEICGKHFEGAEIDHINGIRDDNRAINLRWVTHKENVNNNITKENASKGREYLRKKIIQLTLLGEYIKEYESLHQLERETGYKRAFIIGCCKGIYNKAYGYIWKYKEDA